MVRPARSRGLGLIAALVAVLVGTTEARAGDGDVAVDGDVYLSLTNDDAQADRLGGSIFWVEPLTEWLKGEIGGSYTNFDDTRWGFGVLGAHLAVPGGRNHLSLRYEHGAGRGERGRYDHLIGKVDFVHALLPGQIFLETGFQLIRVDRVQENLVRVGVGLVPLRWLGLHADYHHSVFGGEGTQAWSARSDLHLTRARLFGGYARSEDTVDLRSIGQSRNTGRATHEVFLGVELPVGRHGVTLAATRHESDFDTRYSMQLTLRWNLFFRSGPAEPEPPKSGNGARAFALR